MLVLKIPVSSKLVSLEDTSMVSSKDVSFEDTSFEDTGWPLLWLALVCLGWLSAPPNT